MFTDSRHASYQKHGDVQCSISAHCQLGNSTILEVYNSSMENVEIEEIVCLKSIKVVESKTNTGSEIVCNAMTLHKKKKKKKFSRPTHPILKKLWRTSKQTFFLGLIENQIKLNRFLIYEPVRFVAILRNDGFWERE